MATPEETIEIENADKDRRVGGRQLALIAGGVVVLLVALWFLFLRSDSEPESTGQPAPNAAPTQGGQQNKPAKNKKPDKAKKANKAPKSGGPVENFEVFAPRDPFAPLVVSGAGGDGGGTDDTGNATGDNNNGGGGQNVGGHTVTLVDIFNGGGGEPQAQVRVDDTVYWVSEGEVFAENFQLVSIEGTCATMLFGDDQFTLCEGEEILK